jgi:hypothetical protein
MDFDTGAIRRFIREGFSDEELNHLCFDYFPDVYNDFTSGLTKGQKVQMLLEHCQRQGRWLDLMVTLERERSQAYAKQFENTPRIEQTRRPYVPIQRNPRQIFICHAHQDLEFARQLSNDLQKHKWQTWIAKDNILPGEKWAEAIDRGLEESAFFLLILTPDAVNSYWVKKETYAAMGLEGEGKLRLFPLLFKSCNLPPLWRLGQQIPFHKNYRAGLQALMIGLQPEFMGSLAQLYGQLQTAINAGEWGQAQNLGGRIEEQYPGYQNVSDLLAQAVEGTKKQEAREKKLASLYQQMQKAIKQEEWDSAQTAGQQIQAIDQNYRDVEQLLAQVNEKVRQREQVEQLKLFYQQFKEEIDVGKWDTALKIGQQIQAIDQNYRDVEQLLARVNENVRQREQVEQLKLFYQQFKEEIDVGKWDTALKIGQQIEAIKQNYRDVARLLEQVNENLRQQERAEKLELLYQQFVRTIDAEDWIAAQNNGKQILAIDREYRDVARLLAQVQKEVQRQVRKTKRARFYQQLKSVVSIRNWGSVISWDKHTQILNKRLWIIAAGILVTVVLVPTFGLLTRPIIERPSIRNIETPTITETLTPDTTPTLIGTPGTPVRSNVIGYSDSNVDVWNYPKGNIRIATISALNEIHGVRQTYDKRWVEVQFGDADFGWIVNYNIEWDDDINKALPVTTPSPVPTPTPPISGKISWANCYSNSSVTSSFIRSFDFTRSITAIARDRAGEWVLISDDSGTRCWVQIDYVNWDNESRFGSLPIQ